MKELAKRILCLLGFHDWYVKTYKSGVYYRACAYCGKEEAEDIFGRRWRE